MAAKKTSAKKTPTRSVPKMSKREEQGKGRSIGIGSGGSSSGGRGGATGRSRTTAKQIGNRVTTRLENKAHYRQNKPDSDFQMWQEGVNISKASSMAAKAAGAATTAAIRGGIAAGAIAAAKGANALRKKKK